MSPVPCEWLSLVTEGSPAHPQGTFSDTWVFVKKRPRGAFFKGTPRVPRREKGTPRAPRRGTLARAPFTETQVSEKVPWGWVGLPSVIVRYFTDSYVFCPSVCVIADIS